MDTGRGTFGYYGTLPGTGASLTFVLLQFDAGFPSDSTLEAATTLQAVLALTNVAECNFTNYARIFATVGVAVSITGHVTTLTSPNQIWSNAGGGTNNQTMKCITCFKPSASAVDSLIIPMGQYDFAITTDGSSITAQPNASGLMTAS
jgi:hypothetical protein